MSTAEKQEREDLFRRFFAATHEDVLRFAQRRVHPSHAEDVVAEAFLVAWRRFEEAPAFLGDRRAWLFGIARGCVLNSRRGQDRQQALAVRIAQVHERTPGPGADDPDLIARRVDLTRAWHHLRDAEQEVLALAAFEDLASAQAARVLGISTSAYRLRLMRARRALRSKVGALAPAVKHNPSPEEVPSHDRS